MGVTDKMWDAITTVIKMNDKIERVAETVKVQQQKIEMMNERLIRRETALQLGLTAVRLHGPPSPDRRGD